MNNISIAQGSRWYSRWVPRIRVMMKPQGKDWEHLGTFTADDAVINDIREIIVHHKDPYDAISELPAGTLMRDVLEICRSEGHDVKLIIEGDH